MSNWQITVKQVEEYYLEVEAETREEANEKAWELLETEQGKAKYHHDSDATIESFEE